MKTLATNIKESLLNKSSDVASSTDDVIKNDADTKEFIECTKQLIHKQGHSSGTKDMCGRTLKVNDWVLIAVPDDEVEPFLGKIKEISNGVLIYSTLGWAGTKTEKLMDGQIYAQACVKIDDKKSFLKSLK